MVSFRLHLARLTFLVLTMAGFNAAAATADEKFISDWLDTQSRLKTWTAGFVQTRSLKALTEPLVATGKVFFASPNHFRWELGTPAETIAIRTDSDLWVVYPNLNRAEKYSMTGSLGPWKDALALLEAGFPRSQAELNQKFKLLEQSEKNGKVRLRLQPKSSQARKMMPEMLLEIGAGNFQLEATELLFADGSRLRNDFMNGIQNPVLDPKTFAAPSDPALKIVEPLKK